jgi:hypothetical protein
MKNNRIIRFVFEQNERASHAAAMTTAFQSKGK